MTGHEVSDIHKDGWVYDVQVWTIPAARENLTSVRNMLIDTPRGGHVRLADVASVSVKATPNMIQRENAARRLDVQANVRGTTTRRRRGRRRSSPGGSPIPVGVPREAAR